MSIHGTILATKKEKKVTINTQLPKYKMTCTSNRSSDLNKNAKFSKLWAN